MDFREELARRTPTYERFVKFLHDLQKARMRLPRSPIIDPWSGKELPPMTNGELLSHIRDVAELIRGIDRKRKAMK